MARYNRFFHNHVIGANASKVEEEVTLQSFFKHLGTFGLLLLINDTFGDSHLKHVAEKEYEHL